jgi:predicted aspartyl protease
LIPFAQANDSVTAAAAFQAGDFPAAEALYRAALRDAPENSTLLLRLGTIALYKNDLDEAEQFARAADMGIEIHAEVDALLAQVQHRRERARAIVSMPRGEARIPFSEFEPLPLVQAAVNGQDAFFLLDTGAPEIALDPAFARELGIETTSAGDGIFAGGKRAPIFAGIIERFSIGGVELEGAEMITKASIRALPFFPGKRIDGIIGTRFFAHFLTTIDYPQKQIVLRPRDSELPEPAITSAPMWFVGDHYLFMRAQINDAPEQLFLIDTGLAGTGLLLNKEAIDAAGISLRDDRSGGGVGAAGAVRVVPFVADSVRLAGVVTRDVSGVYTPDGSPMGIFPFATGGLLSQACFESHAITLDFPRMRLVFS